MKFYALLWILMGLIKWKIWTINISFKILLSYDIFRIFNCIFIFLFIWQTNLLVT